MKKILSTFTVAMATACMMMWFSPAQAQLDLPSPSPHASVSQDVGLSSIQIDYSCPGVKGREIWGGLVPYGEMWRTGANQATKITIETDAMVGDKKLEAGSYSFFAIPEKGEWTLILNKKAEMGGTNGYDKEMDAVRLTVKPTTGAMHKERLAYYIEPKSDDEGVVILHWEKLMVSFSVKFNTMEMAEKNIEKTLADMDRKWLVQAQAARFMVENGGDSEKAYAMIDASIKDHDSYYNKMLKSKMLAHEGKYKDAIKVAKKAMKSGDASDSENYKGFWKGEIEKDLAAWAQK